MTNERTRHQWWGLGTSTPVGVRGSDLFLELTAKALDLIGSDPRYRMSLRYVPLIIQHRCTRMLPWYARPRCLVGHRTWGRDTLWYASAIIHEAHHAKLYDDARVSLLVTHYAPLRAWGGLEKELECLRLQARFLRDMKAPERTLAHIAGLIADPAYYYVPFARRDW